MTFYFAANSAASSSISISLLDFFFGLDEVIENLDKSDLLFAPLLELLGPFFVDFLASDDLFDRADDLPLLALSAIDSSALSTSYFLF